MTPDVTDLVARLRERGNGDIADGYEDKAERGQLDLQAANELEQLRFAIRDLHLLADSGESDIRAIGKIIDRFPELRPRNLEGV